MITEIVCRLRDSFGVRALYIMLIVTFLNPASVPP